MRKLYKGDGRPSSILTDIRHQSFAVLTRALPCKHKPFSLL